MGFLVPKTTSPVVTVRGSAPAGKVVAVTVNGELQGRVIAGPSMDVWRWEVALEPGDNVIAAALEGTELQAEKRIHLTVKTFGDLKGHWAKDDAEYLATVGVVNGVGDDAFGPDLTLTRAQFAKMAVLGLKLQAAADPVLGFTDNESIPEWARGFVATAVAEGLITGHSDGSFGPDQPVTRAQVAVIAARALRKKGADAPGRSEAAPGRTFKDADRIPAWARADVAFTASAGLVGDFWGDTFDPDAPATRGLAAAVVRRLYRAK
ncbi:MAG: S-layer domain protein [Symbiobacteriaceae bacterium]|nr:S-layer domain protein [Symbiobacteriaceae bacterium]